ncbi:hypothetical protein Pka01_54270 [Planotetraspora kaengkrachanensis]|uniref:Uncharacterized protein n=1 Tax=Planotetraspora kaengkrachanensis TaxID=575193 RepID=A0A8J3V7R1_9ACTN|nr:hypothetical protein Pka01_54270 [Planotetraspora kaengkrachanensis]
MAEVTNPLYSHLTQLLTRVHKVQDELRTKLDNPTKNMAGGGVWTSPTAQQWGGRLSDQRNKYNSAVDRLDDELVAMIARTPENSSR